jgi:hypothetical protein
MMFSVFQSEKVSDTKLKLHELMNHIPEPGLHLHSNVNKVRSTVGTKSNVSAAGDDVPLYSYSTSVNRVYNSQQIYHAHTL